MPPVNATLSDDWIRHAVLLERFKDGEIRRITDFLRKEVEPSILAKAQRIADRYEKMGASKLSIARRRRALLKQLQQMRAIIAGGERKLYARMKGSMTALAQSEADWAARAMQRRIPLRFDYSMPAPQLLKSLVTTRPMQGRFLRDWSKSVGANAAKNVNAAIMVGVAQGEGVDAIIRRIRGTARAGFKDGVLQATRAEAQMVTRTAVNHFGQAAREAVFIENKNVVEKVQWTSTLDSRTSQICASLDGREYALNFGPRPPAHPNCRSVMVPVVKPPEGIPGIDASKLPVGERAAMAGPVPANQTFGPWLKRQSVATQNQILGKGKADLFRRGKVPIERFAQASTSGVRPLSLAELEAIEKGIKKPRPKPKPKPKPKPTPPPPPRPRRSALDRAKERAAAQKPKELETGEQLRLRLEEKVKRYRQENHTDKLESLRHDISDQEMLIREVRDRLDQLPYRSDDYNALRDKWQKMEMELWELQKQKRQLKSVEDRKLLKLLREEIAVGGNLRIEPTIVTEKGFYGYGKNRRRIVGVEEGARQKVEDARQFLQKLVRTNNRAALEEIDPIGPKNLRARFGEPLKIKISGMQRGQRAFAAFEEGIFIDGVGTTTTTIIHEMLHQIEWNQQLGAAARMYRRYRAMRRVRKNEYKLPRKLNVSGGRKGETGYPDQFIHPYTGRTYGGGSTEILTMLGQQLWQDPVGFMARDPRGFEFIIDLLRGVPVEKHTWFTSLDDAAKAFVREAITDSDYRSR